MNIPEALPLDLGTVTVTNRGSFEVGALYPRRYVHALLQGGGQQSGITRVRDTNVTLIFTGLSGRTHGYFDFWDENGNLNYFGEGQLGDMQLTRGNAAIASHHREQNRLLVFQALGKGLPVRFLGEFQYLQHYRTDAPDRSGTVRSALVFVLQPLIDPQLSGREAAPADLFLPAAGPTTRLQLQEVRTKQEVFRRRLTTIEAGCRLTAVSDLRFLRAGHMKPWAVASDAERTCRENGLLLTPSADLLFDRGWISFRDGGQLLVASELPEQVRDRIGLDLTPGRDCGSFTREQTRFLDYHRDCIFEQGLPGGTAHAF